MRKLVISMFFIAIFTLPCSISAHEGEDHDHDEAAEDTSATNQESGIGWKLIRSLEMGNSGKFVHMVSHTLPSSRMAGNRVKSC